MEEQEKKSPEVKLNRQQSLLLYLHDIIYMLAAVIVIFMLLFRGVVVSGPSMYNTLWDGDYLLVLSSVLYRNPDQGDIVIASKQSYNDGEPIVKRVIATEGQTVDIDFNTGTVYVDGIVLEESYIYTGTFRPEGVSFPLVVEDGCVFVMGDNRESSKDSRDPEIGQIDRREILGKALFLLIPGTDGGQHERDFGRFGVLK